LKGRHLFPGEERWPLEKRERKRTPQQEKRGKGGANFFEGGPETSSQRGLRLYIDI